MGRECSAEELEVARILVALPWLVWEADHPLPCTHDLRWAARKKRSAGAENESPAAAPPPPRRLSPPLPHPSAEKLGKKRGREGTKPCPVADILKVKPSEAAGVGGAAAHAAPGLDAPGKPSPSPRRPAPSRKVARREADLGDDQKQPPAAAVPGPTEELAAAAPETSSPETPLDFCPSGEEPDAETKAKTTARPSPAKKPRLKHEQLSKQVDQLNLTRTKLEKEAAEIRRRLEALRDRNSKLMELRNKLAEEADRHRPHSPPPPPPQRQQEADRLLHRTSCLDLLPVVSVRPSPAARTGPPQQQQYQHAWPQHWVSSHVAVHQAAPGFSVHPPPAAGNQHWNWSPPPTWRLGGDKGSTRASQVPDLNSIADKDLGVETQLQPHHHHHHQQEGYPHHHQQQQQQLLLQEQQRRSSPQEQRAARKKRIEMMQRRRNASAGAGVVGFKMPSFR